MFHSLLRAWKAGVLSWLIYLGTTMLVLLSLGKPSRQAAEWAVLGLLGFAIVLVLASVGWFARAGDPRPPLWAVIGFALLQLALAALAGFVILVAFNQ